MLATVIALHLALGQAPATEPPAPAREEGAPAADRRASEPAPREPAKGDEADELKTGRELPPPTTMRTRTVAKTALVPIPSLLSAEPLGGSSAVVAWAGWSSLGAAYAQGVTPDDDLGVIGDLDWSTGELRLSAFYRRPLGRVGLVDLGARLRAGWYDDMGATWIQSGNLGDRGVEFAPGLVVSTRGAGGVFSLGGDLPIAVTIWRSGGIFAAPKLSFSFETTLYGDLSVGVRVAGSYRAGAGDAPMSNPHALLDLQVLAGWKLF
jgi:hypothetical protein